MLLVVRALGWSLAALVGTITLIILVDYALRLPIGVRVILLAALLVIFARLTVRLIIPSLRTRFSRTDLALRIEQQDESSRGMLAGALELERLDPQSPIESALRDAAITRAASRTRRPASVLRLDQTLHAAGVLLVIMLLAAIPVIRSPAMSSIGLRRALAPWSDASWPKRFEINDATKKTAHAIDESFRVRALVAPSLSDANAVVHWRVLDGNQRPLSSHNRTLLAAQPTKPGAEGRVYESLLDTRSFADRTDASELSLEYRIETDDDRTGTTRITLARPPELLETKITVDSPAYASNAEPSVILSSPTTLSEGPQIVTKPILADSAVAIRWSFSKPIKIDRARTPKWVQSARSKFHESELLQPNDRTVELRFHARESVVLEPRFVDRLGISVRDQIVIDMLVHTDSPPTASVVDPDRDLIATPRATMPIAAQFVDDIGLASIWVSATHAQPRSDSSGAQPEAVLSMEIARGGQNDTTSTHTLNTELDISTLEPKPGDEIWISAHAIDLLNESVHAALAEPIKSEPRIIRIVDDTEMTEQIQRTIAPVLAAIKRLDEQQSTLQQQLESGKLNSSRDQRSLSEQIQSQQRVLEHAEQVASTNDIEDPSFRSMLQESVTALEQAAEAADDAAAQIDQRRQDRALQEQQLVRDRLGRVLEMLDRGQDSWLARRSVQELRDEIRRLKEQTDSLNASSAGKSIAELSADERTTLEKILERQRESAERARAMLDELDERAEALQETDPTQAEALRRAAAQGRGSQIEQTLRQASDEVAGNQTGEASQSQQAAMNELDSMLEEIDHAARNRDSALRRQLATIIDQLNTLIASQTAHLAKLASREDHLDTELISLIENTLGVRDAANGAFPETQTIADHLAQAADAQSIAVGVLRSAPVDHAEAEQHERNALHHLQQALADAQRLEEQAANRESRRLREELRGHYQEALDTQVQIRDLSVGYIGNKLTRRQRSESRAIGRQQDELRTALDAMIADTQDLADASVFAFTHSQLDRAMDAASRALNEQAVPASLTTHHQSAIHMLSALVEVLSDAPSEQKEFEDGQSSGGSGSGSSSGQEEPVIPPIAQLRLLRSLQQLAADQTRALNNAQSAPDNEAVRALVDLQQQIAGEGKLLIDELSRQQEQGNPKPNTPVQVKPREGSLEPSGPSDPQEESP